MTWGKLLQPDVVLGEPVLGLTPDRIRAYDLDGLILDVDETLVPLREAQTSPEVQTWINQLKPCVSLWLVSNNLNENRIRRIGESIGVPYMTGAGKPSRRKLRRAVEAMQMPVERVAMVGDRLFTDVLAGNRLGLFTILVEPMVSPMGTASKPVVRSLEVWLSQRLGVSLQSSP
ncbi:MAG: YqeG family HAD IIIA-type phosphatase [Leptolyngbyaceae cyanobacterium T60_A2020_046]|nr:YqeG family HAD IIIA-type phosphatase [Leptolyngbyaceae cyanobacterium T60_A2020_046]